jgi:hypothetical protein
VPLSNQAAGVSSLISGRSRLRLGDAEQLPLRF